VAAVSAVEHFVQMLVADLKGHLIQTTPITEDAEAYAVSWIIRAIKRTARNSHPSKNKAFTLG
jgi:hypothetical protein